MRTTRAKMEVSGLTKNTDANGAVTGVHLSMRAVAASQYPDDGTDEDNDYARWSPSGSLSLYIANPTLFDAFEVGKKYYIDISEAVA